MAAGALSDICGAGLQPFSSKPWGSAATMTSVHLIPCVAYALVHYSPNLPPGVTAPVQDTDYVNMRPGRLACKEAEEILQYFHMKETFWNKVQHQSARLM